MEEEIKKELPCDVVQSILSRLPVKSLFRFKSVSKSWNSTISDERFAGLHLRQSRQSSGNQDIFFWSHNSLLCWYYYHGYHVIVTKKPESYIQTKTKFHLERKLDPVVLCYCDGLALRRYPRIKDKKYVLLNLYIGTYIEFECPYPIKHDTGKTLYGICYDESTNDYKVVIVNNGKNYAVYHCRSNSWSEMKRIPKDEFSSGPIIMGTCVSLNGNLFWILKIVEPPEEVDRIGNIEIVGFNPSDEKLIKYPRPRNTKRPGIYLRLTCLEGDLCLCINLNSHQKIKIGGEEASWREYDGELSLPKQGEEEDVIKSTDPQYEAMLRVGYSTTEIGYSRFPYLENMFITEPREKHVNKKK